jgi:hypothetical protein
VLFLNEKGTKKAMSLQLFIEPKGQHLLKTDQWKEEFLKEIEGEFKLEFLYENDNYRLVGLPFYNETMKKQEFKEAFNRAVKAGGEDKKSDLYFSDLVPDEDLLKAKKFKDYLPVYSLEAVATAFSEEQSKPEVIGWKKVNISKKFDKDYFIAKVVGRSMEPTIPDGSPCLFCFERGGSRNGKIVLVESRQVTDPETHQKFTIKRYSSEKKRSENGQWRHKKIILSPDNKDFDDIVLENVAEDDFRVVAEFVCVI